MAAFTDKIIRNSQTNCLLNRYGGTPPAASKLGLTDYVDIGNTWSMNFRPNIGLERFTSRAKAYAIEIGHTSVKYTDGCAKGGLGAFTEP